MANEVRGQALDLAAIELHHARVEGYRPETRLNKVVLPAPFGPIRAWI